MNLIKSNLKKAQMVLSNIKVRLEPGNFNSEDIKDLIFSTSPLYHLKPKQAVLSPEEEYLGQVKLMTIRFYGGDDKELYLETLIQNVKDEMQENISMPIDQSLIISYINEALNLYNGFEEQIVEDEKGEFDFPHIEFVDIQKEELDKKDSEIYVSILRSYKKTIRKEIIQLSEELFKLKGSLSQKSPQKGRKIPQNIEEEKSISLATTKGTLVRSFTWTRKDTFQKDMLRLYALLTDEKYAVIPKNTDFKDFVYAFSGHFINHTLKIKWCITGKNSLTSKASIFHFISKLEDHKLIESKDWRGKNNSLLYQKIYSIFTDKDGNPFSLDGLKSSRSQGLEAECAMQNEIDEIVSKVANPKPDKTSLS